MRVQHCHEGLQFTGAETRFKTLDRLRRERNFRHKDYGALSVFQRMGDGLEVDFGFSGAGDAVEEERAAGILPAGLIFAGGPQKCRRDAVGMLLKIYSNLKTSFSQPIAAWVQSRFYRIFSNIAAEFFVLRLTANQVIK